ncbi:uncharacterized protein LOC119996794 [Tripterygium wilfordii]|uniref:uncharacterized protein LOC119996794 n=1 Tax=Tripterygium wilfordii TaxID=458696 RepID=UPI0018F82D2A|nr:uncharacterized protein LOC119996794 [Tripterygium wilfordii]
MWAPKRNKNVNKSVHYIVLVVKDEKVGTVFAEAAAGHGSIHCGSYISRKMNQDQGNWDFQNFTFLLVVVFNFYLECKSLAHSLYETKTAMEELNQLVSGVLLLAITIMWVSFDGIFNYQSTGLHFISADGC